MNTTETIKNKELDYGLARAFDKEIRIRYFIMPFQKVTRQEATKIAQDDIILPFGNK